ncbi:terpenoid synthase [Lentinus tigrinus ALCF2SS1-7]|uniref:Terpene synthase n=1 Tax=Lentinus tigrinus ALCF2SS1-6 TaxID=1328759 RepID=A0A5C2S7T5_9APHY|nr:terpenoid synthase [Lentinus tigrinus ALCF2SS1-6]RPD73612.1 terpenoid synthase [Lentinus tigrinus ALCF2SS1-7]
MTFRLPDTLAKWPWLRLLNPHYAEVKAESSAWLESFHAFGPKAQKAFNKCDFNLLASLAYPLATKEQLRTGCDLMNLFFVFDEYSDVEDERTVQVFADIIMDALRNPHKTRPAGEPVLGEITRQFWERAIQSASESAQRRFISTFDAYCQSVVQQAADRDVQRLRDVNSYLEMRRENIGAKPSFALLELDMNLPDEVLAHPAIVDLTTWAIDMIILGNDICSYNVEQSRGDDGCNIVTIVMHQFQTDLHGAMEWIDNHHKTLMDRFLSYYGHLPTWGPVIDVQVARYVQGVGNWVRANDTWSFESQRYFGLDGLAIAEDRCVTLLPKVPESKLPDRAGPTGVGARIDKFRHLTSRLRGLAVFSLCVLVASFTVRAGA